MVSTLGFCGKRDVPNFTTMNKYMLWIRFKTFWELLIHIVKCEYDSYKGYENKANRKRRRIRRIWAAIPILLDAGDDVKWNYVPPYWLFLPAAPFLVHTT